jgi:endonuclease YncB( thermonuclease family)
MTKIFTLYCHPIHIYDGDTIYGWIDQGLGTWNHGASRNGMGLRLFGLNAREHSQPGGDEARAALQSVIDTILETDGSFVFESMGWDKYSNRVEANIPLPNGGSVNDWMLRNQWAAKWDGVGAKPLPPWPRTI